MTANTNTTNNVERLIIVGKSKNVLSSNHSDKIKLDKKSIFMFTTMIAFCL